MVLCLLLMSMLSFEGIYCAFLLLSISHVFFSSCTYMHLHLSRYITVAIYVLLFHCYIDPLVTVFCFASRCKCSVAFSQFLLLQTLSTTLTTDIPIFYFNLCSNFSLLSLYPSTNFFLLHSVCPRNSNIIQNHNSRKKEKEGRKKRVKARPAAIYPTLYMHPSNHQPSPEQTLGSGLECVLDAPSSQPCSSRVIFSKMTTFPVLPSKG